MNNTIIKFFIIVLSLFLISGCRFVKDRKIKTITIIDQLGRKVKIPEKIERIAALHHFGGKIVYALNQQHLLVEKSIFGNEAAALNKIDKSFAALPDMLTGNTYNFEGLAALDPQIVFMYTSSSQSEREQFENIGIPVVCVKGETIKESFEAIRLMAGVLHCKDKGEQYIKACRDILDMVSTRLENYGGKPCKAMFAGPKSIYCVATGNMLQSRILELSGAINVAKKVKGFWAEVSPEQLAVWNPDVIFLATYNNLSTYDKADIFNNPHIRTINAVRTGRIYWFPSNAGWWDYPAPNCVLGVIWSAKKIYPELFLDIDIKVLANKFYKQFIGYTFEELGGRLN